ncbi:hypothetical protein C7974DRAFT_60989 [Boeremia exigua]|uniref:uncharacterized protein n=1 Tax=Boeremia exigua TaxID=749465 RepID=UPI001E8CFB58|nr:uncharacterized protein C7974DRAFT_60989 [Boeremia exigua]KAH6615209.1 hypothetical protein C7974DRAFT_60989 [Boeremia exigua]
MAEKCGETEIPTTAQDKRRALKKRLMWPFKQETVASMINTLDGLQANVQSAVQLLGIETNYRGQQSLETSITRVEHFQVQALTTMQQGFTDLSQGRMSSNEAVKLLDESKQMCSQLANMEKKLDMLLVVDNVYHTQSPTKPCASQARRISSRCTCRKTRQTQRWWWGLFDLETTRETEHSPTCQLSRYGNTTFTFQADCKSLTRLLNLEIRAGVSYMRMSGCYSMQPMLTVRPIVPMTSPSFAPLYGIKNKMGCTCRREDLYCRWCGTAAAAPSLLQTALNEAIQSFHDGTASPYDTTERGVSVLNLADQAP